MIDKILKFHYGDLVNLAKLIINSNVTHSNNPYLLNLLSRFFLNNSLKRSNTYFTIMKGNKIIGILLANLKNKTVSSRKTEWLILENLTILEEFSKFRSKEDIDIINYEIAVEDFYFKNIWSNEKYAKESEIIFFAVDKEYQSLNIGKKLLQDFENTCQKNDINQYYLFTTNHCNINFYKTNNMIMDWEWPSNKDTTYYVFKKKINHSF